MRNRFWLSSLLVIVALSQARAQDPRFGFMLNLVLPTGSFRSATYGPTAEVDVSQTEGYDLGFGAQFTSSFPVSRSTAIRLSFGGQACDGTNTASGYPKLNLRHEMYSLGAELQVFPGVGDAYRHRGTYLLGGISADFERFDISEGDPVYDSFNTTRKSRMGMTVGLGHSFGYGGLGRFTMEAAYHTSLSSHDVNAGDPPATDFVKLGFGWVF